MAESNPLNRLIGDLKASWPKTALLAVLFCVGLYFWIPPLYRALVGAKSQPANPVSPAVPATAAPSSSAPTVPAAPETSADDPQKSPPRYSWQTVDDVLSTDRLAQSAEVEAIAPGAFQIDFDQFSPPLLFAEETVEETARQSKSNPDATQIADVLDQLVLKSTIVGASRRAALINQKLYREGSDIAVEGRVYRLESVHARKVVLRRGEEQFELTIAEKNAEGSERRAERKQE